MTRIAIIGASGRMGLAIARAAALEPGLTVVGAVASSTSASLGRDLGELAGIAPLALSVSPDIEPSVRHADAVIDFSQAGAVARTAQVCAASHKPLVVGTTGFDALGEAALVAAAKAIPVLVAANTSLGVTLLMELVREAAQALPNDFDIEILEAHHRLKKDSPSGTALALGQAAAAGRGQSFDAVARRAGHPGVRDPGTIGFASVRAGDIVGDHSVMFAGDGERLVLEHRATDRSIFARGALVAARWLVHQPAGRYAMRDVLLRKTAS